MQTVAKVRFLHGEAVIEDLFGEVGLSVDPALIRHLDGTPDRAFEAAVSLLKAHPDVTAIVCASDRLAYGALPRTAHLGRRVGEDIAIIGHDDMPDAGETYPPLTTVRTRVGRIARTAVETLVAGRTAPEVTSVKGDLVVRGTTGEARPDS